MRRLLCLSIAGLLLRLPVLAQDSTDYQKWLKQEKEKFQEFKDARDREFSSFLKQEWKETKPLVGLVPDETPKPPKMPVYQPPAQPPREAMSEPVRLQPIPVPSEQKEPKPKPASAIPESNVKNGINYDVTFFNTQVRVPFDERAKPALIGTVNKEAISEFWASLSKSHYEELIAQVQRDRVQMDLNDWGFVQFLYKISQRVFDGSRNEATLLTWFMLSKCGYDSKVGYNNNRIYLLLPSETRLYYVSYMHFANDQRRFYGPPLEPGTNSFDGPLYSYEGKYPGADKTIDFAVKEMPKLRHEVVPRKLNFTYEGKLYEFNVRMSKDAVELFSNYPLTDMKLYFDAPASMEAIQSLFPRWRAILQGKTELEAVNMLLRFVQTAFEYKTDPEQFGREKPLFPDEMLFYPYSDCKSHSILFAYLVRHLLGLDVVGLDYPGHIATAVLFGSSIAGDSVEFHGQRYVICDPTYINADVGACMPKFKSVNPGIISMTSHPITK